ncbi:bifunctional pyr operon transcriptional regulator/uracil phosphoribosyltransferase PyrR [bacterium]|nr:bifunctional pyr operon transcriptional regulator/uracil phosphoribosyltransferase PyrR [bacterium]
MVENLKKQIMDEQDLNRLLGRFAYEILERNHGSDNLVFLGIVTRGVPLAERILTKIEKIEGKRLPLGILDITMYRDDVFTSSKQPQVRKTEIDFDIDDMIVILVDDVLYTGRTIRAAMDATTDFGRPKKIQLAVLIDRGHRELPIRPDYVGETVVTSEDETVQVMVEELDGKDGVFLVKPNR